MLMMAGSSSGVRPTARASANRSESISGFCKEEVDRQDDDHHHQHDLREQVAEAMDAALELGLRRAQAQPLGDLAKDRGLAGLDDQDPGGAAAHAGAHEDAVGALGQAGLGRHNPRPLLHREGLAGEHGLVDEEVIRRQHDAIGRDQAAGGEQHHIARARSCSDGSVLGLPSRRTLDRIVTCERSFSTALPARYSCTKPSTVLPSTMASTMTASVHSPTMAETIAAPMRMRTSGLLNWLRNRLQRRRLPLDLERVPPVLLEARRGVRRLEAVGAGVQGGQEFLGRDTPVVRRRCLGVRRPGGRRCSPREASEGFHPVNRLPVTVLPAGPGRTVEPAGREPGIQSAAWTRNRRRP